MRFHHTIVRIIVMLVASWGSGVSTGAPQSNASNLFFRAWQTADGLPDNSVTGVVQAPDGYLWVATEGGLMRFNGTSLTNISLRNFPNVRSRAVRTMLFDRHGQLWLGMERGPLIRLGRHGGRTFWEADGLFPQDATALAEDGEGAVWVAFPDGICRIVEDEVVRFEEKEGLPKGGNTWVGRDVLGRIWFAKGSHVGVFGDGTFHSLWKVGRRRALAGSASGAGVWIGDGCRLMSYREGREPEERGRLPDNVEASVMLEDSSGALWIGTAGEGLFRLADGLLERVPTSNPDIDCLNQDLEGNIWAGTNGGGLNLIRPRAMELINRAAGLPFDSVKSVCEDATGGIWAVGQNGDLATRIHGVWSLAKGMEDKATCVAAGTEGGVWAGTLDAGIRHFHDGVWSGWRKEDGLPSDTVRSVLPARNGDVWIATDSPNEIARLREGGLVRFEAVGEVGAIPAMAEGLDGTIWIGTEDGRILRAGEEALVDEPVLMEASPMPVRSLCVSPDGSLWIGYAGDGLGCFRDGKHTLITTANGLMDDHISQLLVDGQGALWFAANRGVFQINLSELLALADGRSEWVRSRVYGRGEGLPSLQPNRDHFPAACRASDGHLWFSMRNGLVVAQPEKIRDNPAPPSVLLEKVTLDDQPAALYGNRTTLQRDGKGQALDLSIPDAVLHVPPGHDKLKFEFAALSFASPENVHFRYRLKNFDREWVEADTQHSATYPRLAAGNYEFRVIACNNAGVWNDKGVALAIEVAPFFWETWWFRIGGSLGTMLVVGGGVYLGQRRRHLQQLRRFAEKRAIEEERARIARDIHDDLGSNLTRIMLLSRPSNGIQMSSEAAIMPQIHSTSRHLIRAMAEVVWAVNPEQDSFDGLADYLSNYAQAFLGIAGIRCRLDMPLKLPERSLSAQIRHNLFLAFKEALHNVVKHAEATEVRILLTPGVSSLALEIEDNGRGIGGESDTGNGLANMHRRLDEIGGSCEIKSGPDGGTIVKFEIQLKQQP